VHRLEGRQLAARYDYFAQMQGCHAHRQQAALVLVEL
jgi:hypothetical protein